MKELQDVVNLMHDFTFVVSPEAKITDGAFSIISKLVGANISIVIFCKSCFDLF